jgi:hypothetical protein
MPVIAALVVGAGAVLLAQTATTTAAIPKADAKDWIQLFNGKDLTGWTPKFAKHDFGENYNNTFRVEDGLLKVRYDKWETFNEEFGHMFYKDPFSYYVIAAEYRFVGDQVKGHPEQRPDAARSRSQDDDEGSGFSDLNRGAAARRLRQAPHDRQSLHARYQRRHGRQARDPALHQFELQDV